MKPAVVMPVLTLAVVLALTAAEPANHERVTSNYDLVEARAVPSSASADLLLISCSDAENNYYVEQQRGDHASGPILKFDKTGRLRATFALPAGLMGSRFIVDENQSLYRLAMHVYNPNPVSLRESDFDRLVLVYTKDGSLKKAGEAGGLCPPDPLPDWRFGFRRLSRKRKLEDESSR